MGKDKLFHGGTPSFSLQNIDQSGHFVQEIPVIRLPTTHSYDLSEFCSSFQTDPAAVVIPRCRKKRRYPLPLLRLVYPIGEVGQYIRVRHATCRVRSIHHEANRPIEARIVLEYKHCCVKFSRLPCQYSHPKKDRFGRRVEYVRQIPMNGCFPRKGRGPYMSARSNCDARP